MEETQGKEWSGEGTRGEGRYETKNFQGLRLLFPQSFPLTSPPRGNIYKTQGLKVSKSQTYAPVIFKWQSIFKPFFPFFKEIAITIHVTVLNDINNLTQQKQWPVFLRALGKLEIVVDLLVCFRTCSSLCLFMPFVKTPLFVFLYEVHRHLHFLLSSSPTFHYICFKSFCIYSY